MFIICHYGLVRIINKTLKSDHESKIEIRDILFEINGQTAKRVATNGQSLNGFIYSETWQQRYMRSWIKGKSSFTGQLLNQGNIQQKSKQKSLINGNWKENKNWSCIFILYCAR
jgi:hypothetical protein